MIGFVLRAIDAPVAPVMIGLILGPAAEQHLRRALSISQGDWTVSGDAAALAGAAARVAPAVLAVCGRDAAGRT